MPSRQHFAQVEGVRISFLAWGDPARPGLILVHGGAAHAHWWSFLAPQLTHHYRVIAIDLSGHGDSEHRERYTFAQWAAEILAVAENADFPGRPVLVGHSMGGLVSIATAALAGDRLEGAIIVDSPVRRPDPESVEGQRGRSFRNPKSYPTVDAAVERFRLVPEQPARNDWILDYIARRSLRPTSDGQYTWKFDPRVFTHRERESLADHLVNVGCRIALMRGEYSRVVPPETQEYMLELLDGNVPLVEIPDAHHHLILDQPLAFIAALRALLADWQHTVPRHR